MQFISYKILNFTLILLMCFNCNAYYLVNDTIFPKINGCGVSKQGELFGEATMFQESWVHGKTGACGFEKPFSALAEGFFTAVGTEDWDSGFACGTCVEVGYKGRKVIVNVVDRCGACTKGWFDLGGPAWTALTGELPGHIHEVTSRWVECPRSLTDGQNIHIYVKPGSHAWDARFQPVLNEMPVTGMSLDAGSGWMEMKKCENYMFCKPGGVVLGNSFGLRVSSVNKNIDVQVEGMPDGQYIDTGTNNGGAQCSSVPPSSTSSPTTSLSTALTSALSTAISSAITSAFSSSSPPPPTTTAAPEVPVIPTSVDCSTLSGLYPDPDDCRGFIKCAQGDRYSYACGGGLYFDVVTYNCNWPWDTDCGTRPVPQEF